jgi:catechol 2,3-dioxygenase-like lactoylglutathione lyase family enzyme
MISCSTMTPPQDHVLFILYVGDQARSARFYATVLGVEPVLDVPGMTELPLTEGARLGLMPAAGIKRLLGDAIAHPDQARGVPRCELYLRVDDPQASYERALAAGARAIEGPRERSWGEIAAYVADPDEHIVAFARPGPAAGG